MVGRRNRTKYYTDDKEERRYDERKQFFQNATPEERLARKRKRHNDTVTRFYYRNKDKVLKRKRLRYLQNKGLDKDEIIWQLLNNRTDLSQNEIRKNIA